MTLIFFWLNNIDLAKERVKVRVKEGGHSIPEEIIKRRYIRGIKNLFDMYIQIVDNILIFDNSFGKHKLIAQNIDKEGLLLIDEVKFNQLYKFYDEERITD